MRVVGLTGGIATGKSSASEVFRERGVPVIDADLLARRGQPANLKIRREFGDEFFHENGSLNREKMGAKVFADPQARRRLNAITHPAVRWEMVKQLLLLFFSGTRLAVLDTPLLFEVGYDRVLGTTIVIWCTEEQELERLMARDGLSREDALARIHAQMPLSEKRRKATHLIDNTGDKQQLKEQLHRLIDELESSWTPWVVRGVLLVAIVLPLLALRGLL